MASSRQHSSGTVPATDGLTVIGQGIHVHGRIHGEEDLRIEGRVEGGISLTETVYIAESGVVVATIDARDVVVSGVVVGNVSATNSVSLEPGAKLVGDISAPRLIIADGAAFRGNVAMTEGGSAPPKRARTTTSRSSSSSTSTKTKTTKASRSSSSSSSTSQSRASTAKRSTPRVAAIRAPKSTARPDDEVTVIVKHAALSEEEEPKASKSTKKKAKKSPPRGRVPKPGKRRVNRR
ncbi:MAG: polymer-forming cytoskeletal protein [Myxococcota bacterium]